MLRIPQSPGQRSSLTSPSVSSPPTLRFYTSKKSTRRAGTSPSEPPPGRNPKQRRESQSIHGSGHNNKSRALSRDAS
ncbi:hypothetical protein E2C01_080413 [Portunus trituberculatus]|uniref:Uncharacterized protein n=1 Tax=Portunus trituberculatus TaxID=210409 RepID=A0A5B7IJN6_PORTR|nr:hypothetical protein [Portunus trituberculatus]